MRPNGKSVSGAGWSWALFDVVIGGMTTMLMMVDSNLRVGVDIYYIGRKSNNVDALQAFYNVSVRLIR